MKQTYMLPDAHQRQQQQQKLRIFSRELTRHALQSQCPAQSTTQPSSNASKDKPKHNTIEANTVPYRRDGVPHGQRFLDHHVEEPWVHAAAERTKQRVSNNSTLTESEFVTTMSKELEYIHAAERAEQRVKQLDALLALYARAPILADCDPDSLPDGKYLPPQRVISQPSHHHL
ncbi:hypothetical protein LTR17_004559 [Elasticomyces elasticus]|nr:hypothetical protein LTR17_004559 [Elasticomyces elasticus]